ncbi:MAG: 4-demethylwyosine synthase TYW1 [Thermoplasmata archaeon]
MLDLQTEELLQRQGYKLVGSHSGVKLCHWTKQTLKHGRGCYKHHFYGIESHRCMQMTPTVNNCNLGCLFCWRDQSYWGDGLGNVDAPDFILSESLAAQRALLSGYKGNPKVELEKWIEANEVKHVAISLTGEPTMYPRLGEFITSCHEKGLTTFLVTNGTNPKVLEMLDPLPTQLYVTVAAPNKEVYNELCLPRSRHEWENLMRTLELLPSLNTRRVIRHTLVDGYNLGWEEEYARLDGRTEAEFIECKGYVWIGQSRDRLTLGNMPSHRKVREFASRLAQAVRYDFKEEVKDSRVVLLTKPGVDPKLPV